MMFGETGMPSRVWLSIHVRCWHNVVIFFSEICAHI